MAKLLLYLIGLYRRFVSPALPAACRFTPTCSAYAQEALLRYGAARGSWLAARRL
ncbi:MAG: membrane protein insertion efficiency factor YidD, partial [Longimicrobiales bacterium]